MRLLGVYTPLGQDDKSKIPSPTASSTSTATATTTDASMAVVEFAER